MGIFHVMIVKNKTKSIIEVTLKSHNLHKYLNAVIKNAKDYGMYSYKFREEFTFNLLIY